MAKLRRKMENNKLFALNIYNNKKNKDMTQESLNKADYCIELLKEIYEEEILDGANRHDFRLVSLLEIIKKIASWRKRCNLTTNYGFRRVKW